MFYSQLISIEHLLQSWDEFKKGKRKKIDVGVFERNLENNLFSLHVSLKEKTYEHSQYIAFNVYDPKFRQIHKAKVLDRIVHHAVVSIIEPIFEKSFIYDSYSCRKGKGTHKAVTRLKVFIRKASKNHSSSCFVLKLDIKKFFASVNHAILFEIIKKRMKDPDLLWLIENILNSFSGDIGIPIGNLTSQIFANIYLNELDQFIKSTLREKFYIRYCDDFVIISNDKEHLKGLILQIETFLKEKLKLFLHDQKRVIRKYTQGIDFLGYIVLPRYILPRTKTKKRIFQKLKQKVGSPNFNQSFYSYLGYLSHANSYKLQEKLKNQVSVWRDSI